MISVCLVIDSKDRIKVHSYPITWKKFCNSMLQNGIVIYNCPIDFRNEEKQEFIREDGFIKPDIIWLRSPQQMQTDIFRINSFQFVKTCADKWLSYKALLPYHAITYLGSEYFVLNSNKKYIVKPRRGSRKQGVVILLGSEIMKSEKYLSDIYIIQEYKQTWYQKKSNHDIRCMFCGENYLGSIIRRGPLGEKRQIEAIQLEEKIIDRVSKRAKKLLLHTKTDDAIFSIDIGIEESSGKPFVIECTSAPGIPSLIKIDCTGEVISSCIKKMKKIGITLNMFT